MDNLRREQIFATKEGLHQLTQTAEEDEQRSQLRMRREKEQAIEKEKEDERYLRRHNKTVARVLSQAAKADGGVSSSGEEGSDGETRDESEDEESEQEVRTQQSKNQDRASGGNGGEVREQPTASTSTGKNPTLHFIYFYLRTRRGGILVLEWILFLGYGGLL